MNDPELLAERLKVAVDAVQAANVPEDLRAAAFARALDVVFGPVPPPEGNSGSPRPGVDAIDPLDVAAEPGQAEDGLHPSAVRLASKLAIDWRTAEQVYDLDEEGLHLVIAPSRLARAVGTAIEQIARMVTAGRQAAGLEEWTSISKIRDACHDRGKYDESNFSRYIGRLDGDGFRIRGAGQRRELKVNAAGLEATGTLIASLVGQEDGQ